MGILQKIRSKLGQTWQREVFRKEVPIEFRHKGQNVILRQVQHQKKVTGNKWGTFHHGKVKSKVIAPKNIFCEQDS